MAIARVTRSHDTMSHMSYNMRMRESIPRVSVFADRGSELERFPHTYLVTEDELDDDSPPQLALVTYNSYTVYEVYTWVVELNQEFVQERKRIGPMIVDVGV